MGTAVDEFSAAQLFEIVWNTLVGVLGTAATATMFRRAASNAAMRRPTAADLQGFEVVRDGLEYRFMLPLSWTEGTNDSSRALRALIRDELCPLLEELTGQVVLRLLGRKPELQRRGLIAEPGEST